MRLNHGCALHLKHVKPSLRMIMKRTRFIILHNDLKATGRSFHAAYIKVQDSN